MGRILIGLIGIPLGFVIMVYRITIVRFTGKIAFAEQYFNGGTYTFMVLVGILVSIFSMMYAFGTLQDFFMATVGRFF